MRILFIPLTFLFFAIFSNNIAAQEDMTAKGGFVANPAEEHNFLFLLDNRPNDLQELRTGITKYIWKYYPNDKLKITQIKIGGDLESVPLILVSGFSNKNQVMAFYKGLKQNRPDFLQMGMTKDYYALSKTNYEQVVRAKSANGYKAFFEENYLKGL
jgi:hypothetical protein